mgnify:CR=1 FL=1
MLRNLGLGKKYSPVREKFFFNCGKNMLFYTFDYPSEVRT